MMDLSEGKMTISVNNKGGGGNKTVGKHLHDASRMSATPSPRLSMLRKRLSMRRNDAGSGSFKGNGGGGGGVGTEGESLLHRLKRQVRLDRKSLLALCAELDKERSASAVAANQTMAMINRLQKEKAAVQMEALQYQRMMEEQAEYDQEALQALKKRLARRERAFKVLEAEVVVFRERYPGDNFKFEDGFGSESEEEMMDVLHYMDGDLDIGGDDDRFKIRSRSSSFTNRKSESIPPPLSDNDKGGE